MKYNKNLIILILTLSALPVTFAQKPTNFLTRGSVESPIIDGEVTAVVILDSFGSTGLTVRDGFSELMMNQLLDSRVRVNAQRVNALRSNGFEVIDESVNLVTVRATREELDELRSMEGVKGVVVSDMVFQSFLSISVGSMNASPWWNNYYNGSWVDVAVVDSGVRTTHEALATYGNGSPRSFIQESFVEAEGPEDLDGHGTHVAGIIGSTHSTYKGVAFGVESLINAKALNASGVAETSWLMNAMDWAVTNASVNADILSCSWGSYSSPDGDSEMSKFVDALVDNYDTMMVFAAGNAGPDNYSIGVPGDAYNVITVGAVDDMDTVDRADDVIADYSSRGPAYGVYYLEPEYYGYRKKPDVVAPGTYIASSYASADDAYAYMSGTSMAAPHVSGAAALLRDYGLSPREVKALLINTAEDLGNSGWDEAYGWGYVDLGAAWDSRDHVISGVVNESGLCYVGNVSPDDKFTLVWNRHVDYDDVTNVTFSDLDLELFNNLSDGIMSSVSWLDNVEQVVSDDFYVNALIGIMPYDLALPNESFALSLPGGFVEVTDRPNVTFTYSRSDDLNHAELPGEFVYNISLFNAGNLPVEMMGYLSYPDSLTSVDWVSDDLIEWYLNPGEYYNRSIVFSVSEPDFNRVVFIYMYRYCIFSSSFFNGETFKSVESPSFELSGPTSIMQYANKNFLVKVDHDLGIASVAAEIESPDSVITNPWLESIGNGWYYIRSSVMDLGNNSLFVNAVINNSALTSEVFSNTFSVVNDSDLCFDLDLYFSFPGVLLDVYDDSFTVYYQLIDNANVSPSTGYFFVNASEYDGSPDLDPLSSVNGTNSFDISAASFPGSGDYLFGLFGNDSLDNNINGSPYYLLFSIYDPDVYIESFSHGSSVEAESSQTLSLVAKSFDSRLQAGVRVKLQDADGSVVQEVYDGNITFSSEEHILNLSWGVPSTTGSYFLNATVWVSDEVNLTNNAVLSAVTIIPKPYVPPSPGNPPSGGSPPVVTPPPTIEEEVEFIEDELGDVNTDLDLLDDLASINLSDTIIDLIANLTDLLARLEDNSTINRSSLLVEAQSLMSEVNALVPVVELAENFAGIVENSELDESAVNGLNVKTGGEFVSVGVTVLEERQVFRARDRLTNVTSNATRITKRVYNDLNVSLVNFSLVEVIPKSYAESASELVFHDANVLIIDDDPVVAWLFDELAPGEEARVSYELAKDVSTISESRQHSVFVNAPGGKVLSPVDVDVPSGDGLDAPFTGFQVLGDGEVTVVSGLFSGPNDLLVVFVLSCLFFGAVFISRHKIRR